MSVKEDQDATDSSDDPAQAFEAMRRQLALLTAAVEGFASRQSKLKARDYGPDLAALIDRPDKLREALYTLAEQPGVALTPETMAAELVEAGKSARDADHRMIAEAATAQRSATAALDTVIGTARTRKQQRGALILAAPAGMVAMLLLFIGADWLRTRIADVDQTAVVEAINNDPARPSPGNH